MKHQQISKDTEQVYDSISRLYADKFSSPSVHLDEITNRLEEGDRVLDLGCGPGIDSLFLTNAGLQVTGVDISREMLKVAKGINPNATFMLGDILRLDSLNGSFNGIVASYSLIHISKKDMLGALKSLYHILKDGGWIFIGVQEGESKEVILPEPLDPKQDMFLNIMSKKEIKQLIKSVGFMPVVDFLDHPKDKEEFSYGKYVIIAQK